MARVDALDEITAWIKQSPERVGAYAFMAAKVMTRDGLAYGAVFDRCFRAAVDADLSERAARTRVFHGFAAAAAGRAEPPPWTQDADG